MLSLRILFITYESHPTFRPDVATLFGKYLPRLGVAADLVTDAGAPQSGNDWGGGRAWLAGAPGGRLRRQLAKAHHNLRTLARAAAGDYAAVQVRDLPLTAAFALLLARRKGLRFFYWMSFPLPESQILRARALGPRAGLRYWFPLLQGRLGKLALDRFVLARADNVFVQSEQMRRDLAARGVPPARMTAVPMGVDLELARPDDVPPSDDPRLRGRRVVVHLGVLERQRRSELLLDVLARARRKVPDLVLVLAGDTDAADADYRAELSARATALGLDEAVIWTGWLPTAAAWRYLRAAEVALSVIPRGELYDCASPTKVVEYLAFGLPVVANDQPDQAEVVRASGCGECVPLTAEAFGDAVLALLADPARRAAMGRAGRAYVERERSYAALAARLAGEYARLTGPEHAAGTGAVRVPRDAR
jgi:glycosyltransferase involved in cell wall biosynthesis